MLNGMDLLLDCSGGKKKGGERITLTLQALLAGKMLQLTHCMSDFGDIQLTLAVGLYNKGDQNG